MKEYKPGLIKWIYAAVMISLMIFAFIIITPFIMLWITIKYFMIFKWPGNKKKKKEAGVK